jgi:hypothetical protein
MKAADGRGHEYISLPAKNVTTFVVSGALGKHDKNT